MDRLRLLCGGVPVDAPKRSDVFSVTGRPWRAAVPEFACCCSCCEIVEAIDMRFGRSSSGAVREAEKGAGFRASPPCSRALAASSLPLGEASADRASVSTGSLTGRREACEAKTRPRLVGSTSKPRVALREAIAAAAAAEGAGLEPPPNAEEEGGDHSAEGDVELKTVPP